jgi:hypothetical protein
MYPSLKAFLLDIGISPSSFCSLRRYRGNVPRQSRKDYRGMAGIADQNTLPKLSLTHMGACLYTNNFYRNRTYRTAPSIHKLSDQFPDVDSLEKLHPCRRHVLEFRIDHSLALGVYLELACGDGIHEERKYFLDFCEGSPKV